MAQEVREIRAVTRDIDELECRGSLHLEGKALQGENAQFRVDSC